MSRGRAVAVLDAGPIPFSALPNAADHSCRWITAGSLNQLARPGLARTGFYERVMAAGGIESYLRGARFRLVQVRLADLGDAIPGELSSLERSTLKRLRARYRAGQPVDAPVLWRNPDPDVDWDIIDGTHRLVAARQVGRMELPVYELLAPAR